MSIDKSTKRRWRMRRAFGRFYEWRIRHIGTTQYLTMLSIVVGAIAGVTAAVLKTLTHIISGFLSNTISPALGFDGYVLYPFIGISITVVFIKLILRQNISGGIPRVLYSISKEEAVIKPHNM